MDAKLQHFQEQIGRNIIAAREYRNKNQAELAGLVGINKGTLSKIESGKTGASVEMLIKISEALNVRLFKLMLDEDDLRVINALTGTLPLREPLIEKPRNMGRTK